MSAYDDLLADLAGETAALDRQVDPLSAAELGRPTPAEGWTVADQLAHLAGFDEASLNAIREPEAFAADVERRIREADDPVGGYTRRGREMDPAAVRLWWHSARRDLLAAAHEAGGSRIPWYGPSMSPMSFMTARLMETWAHGQDIRDALGVAPEATDRLRHVAHLGVSARGYSYLVNGLDAPDAPIDVALVGPGGDVWRWGSGDAEQRVEGSALDFCLLVTQRRHRDDTALVATGHDADAWLDLAQAFAGPPGSGRQPLP